MGQEIIKRVGERAYRYRVDRVTDPATGRSRAKWTYLGRLEQGASPPVQDRAAAMRTRLIDALERVLERTDYRELTADAVASAAGVAHGTFYRYFKDKREAVGAALDRVKETIDRQRPRFDDRIGTRDEERARVRAWVSSVVHAPIERTGLLRAWYDILSDDLELRTSRDARRQTYHAEFGAYLGRLAAAGIIEPVAEPAFAASLLALFDAIFRAIATEHRVVDQPLVDGVAAVFDRAIFGRASTNELDAQLRVEHHRGRRKAVEGIERLRER
ncbi:MAG TPA: TetR/AcrR family transcriptional regulator [Candidatus Acidoferrales bacterium]|nr:TetR/AcrR family transcriptional regulator [Candidatus Acidoferrales bacterium]